MIYNYQNEAPREYSRASSSSSRRPQYSQQGAYSDSQASYSRPTYSQSSYASSTMVKPAVQQSQNVEFSNMVETSKCRWEDRAPAAAAVSYEYDMTKTTEHKASIPYLHPIDIPQVIHDTKVVMSQPQIVMVPQPVVQVKVEEKLIREKPTDVHHITLASRAQAPVAFGEETAAAAWAWPWWWWIPLILLCC